MDATLIWKFLAGIGFFLYGLLLMDQALTKLSGRSFKKFLRKHTNNVWKAIAGGTLLTALLQTSSVIALITLGFVEAGMIPFKNALGVIMGSNLGSTMIGWIIATVGFKVNIEDLALPALAISTIIMFFVKPRKNLFNSFRLLLAVALIFYGLGFMKEAAGIFVEQVDIAAYRNYPLIVFVLIGLITTSIVQTSSATMAITLTALNSNVISFPAAASVIIGSEVGTSLKTLIAGINGSGEKKRAAYGNFFFNVATVLIAFVFLRFILLFITDVVSIRDPLIGLAFFQSLINLIAIIVFLPFIDPYANWLQRRFSGSDTEGSFLSRQFLDTDEHDPGSFCDEVTTMLDRNLQFHDVVMDVNRSEKEGFIENVKAFARVSGYTNSMYNRLKVSAGELLEYHVRASDNNMSAAEHEQMDGCMETLRQIMHSAKSVKDIHHNITELRETAKDVLHDHFYRIQDDWMIFKNDFLQLRNNPQQLGMLMDKAHEDMRIHNDLIQDGLRTGKLEEVEASTLLNIEREMLSSKKAIIRAAET
ncbi:MAG TPA: Na/Pi symporter, partial [Chitinophagaceae bacterium]|nr:Na/Pi symporter [Chitinophagaceae bacterium]